MKRGIAKEEEMKLGKKTVVTIGVLLSALLCVNMILYTPASADGNTKLKTSKNDISSETVNMHQGVSTPACAKLVAQRLCVWTMPPQLGNAL